MPNGSPDASSPNRSSRPSGATSSRGTEIRWPPRSSATASNSISAARGSTPCVRSTNRATRCPNYLPPISATDPQPNTVACSARKDAKHYQVKYRKDTLVPRSEGRIARWIDRILDREFVPKKLYDTLRDHTPVQIFPRDIDYTEWETLRKYPLLNWNMGMVYNLRESDERIYPQGELGRRTIGLTGDRGNYGIEAVYREELAGRDGRATRQRIARGFTAASWTATTSTRSTDWTWSRRSISMCRTWRTVTCANSSKPRTPSGVPRS